MALDFKKYMMGNFGIRTHRVIVTTIGLTLSIIWGGYMVMAALDHNPQEEYIREPWLLLPIFYSWLCVFGYPFVFFYTFRNLTNKVILQHGIPLKILRFILLVSSLLALAPFIYTLFVFSGQIGWADYNSPLETYLTITGTICALIFPFSVWDFIHSVFYINKI